MAVTSTRSLAITFSGDVSASLAFQAANNVVSPGDIDILSLTTGNNTIALPTGGSTPKGATIIPPAGNTVAITLKGVAGDTGILLHLTDPATISFGTPVPANIVLNVASNLDGLRIIWT